MHTATPFVALLAIAWAGPPESGEPVPAPITVDMSAQPPNPPVESPARTPVQAPPPNAPPVTTPVWETARCKDNSRLFLPCDQVFKAACAEVNTPVFACTNTDCSEGTCQFTL